MNNSSHAIGMPDKISQTRHVRRDTFVFRRIALDRRFNSPLSLYLGQGTAMLMIVNPSSAGARENGEQRKEEIKGKNDSGITEKTLCPFL
ncbi:hypothetical protein KQX54_013138 [Cotesia glomerata]|uniref:Uncharacterized protein n=1 Tax=Cotesia glomerata TaxID=32391 RepID=A0AAV7J3S6_COTGL|nr:hypothetical protein KQX54_013138 [Cotesia glomerata]